METRYLSSEDVKAFPASWRGAESSDPESSLTTETSLRRLAYARFSHRSTAYFDTSSNEFVIVVDGYVFVVSPKAGVSDPWLAAIGKITELFPDPDPNTGTDPVTDIYAGITVAAMGMTVGDTQYNVANGLFEQLRSSNSINNALDGVPAGSELSSFYGLQLSDTKPTGLSACLHILHKGEDGQWVIPEESKFVTDTNQVQNRGGDVSIGTRLDTKEVYVTPSGEMSSEPTETPYSQLTPDALQVATSKASGGASRLLATAHRILLFAPTDGGGGMSEAGLKKYAESLAISDDTKIEVSAPTVSIKGGEGNSIDMSKGKPIEVVGANGISLDNSSASTSEPIEAKSAKIAVKSRSVEFESDSDSSEAKVDVKGSLSVSHRGVFGTKSDGSDVVSVSDAAEAVSLFWNGMEYKAIAVSSSVSVPDLIIQSDFMVNLGGSFRSFFLVQEVQLQDVYTSTGAVVGGLDRLPDGKNYSQLWDLTFTFSPGLMEMWNCLAAGRLIGEWYGKAKDNAINIKNVLDANRFPYDAVLSSSFSNSRSDIRTMTFTALLNNQVRTSTIPVSTVNGWFTNG